MFIFSFPHNTPHLSPLSHIVSLPRLTPKPWTPTLNSTMTLLKYVPAVFRILYFDGLQDIGSENLERTPFTLLQLLKIIWVDIVFYIAPDTYIPMILRVLTFSFSQGLSSASRHTFLESSRSNKWGGSYGGKNDACSRKDNSQSTKWLLWRTLKRLPNEEAAPPWKSTGRLEAKSEPSAPSVSIRWRGLRCSQMRRTPNLDCAGNMWAC